jgi:hypothetical protein
MRERNELRRETYGSVRSRMNCVCQCVRRVALQLFPNFVKYLQLPAGVEIKSCGHYAHVECHRAYVKTVLVRAGRAGWWGELG